ncbi:MAG: hypothetical protein HY360_15270 [Verrucomicrobia bacterium]|nr:hypothetical protein [Verrucomicrobiota bacterium]
MKTEIKRYALAACSGRGLYMYAKPLVETYEGWRLALNGTTDRLEATDWHSGPYMAKDQHDIRLHRWNGAVFNISTETIRVPIDTSGHFGGDVRIQRMLFDGPQAGPDRSHGVLARGRDVAAHRRSRQPFHRQRPADPDRTTVEGGRWGDYLRKAPPILTLLHERGREPAPRGNHRLVDLVSHPLTTLILKKYGSPRLPFCAVNVPST